MESRKRILIADDEPLFLRYYDKLFTRLGYETICVSDGREALDKLKELASNGGLPEYMLTDDLMPRVDGNQVIESMHKQGLVGRVKVALCTGTGNEDLRKRIESFGAAFFVKPPVYEEIVSYFRD